MVDPASALPLINVSSEGKIIGAAGAVVSMVIVNGAVEGEEFPAASVAVAVKVCDPSLNGEGGVNVQLPALSTTLEPRKIPEYKIKME
jgi:hypothetical protein